MSYADVINEMFAEANQTREQMEVYGGLMAQSGVAWADVPPMDDMPAVRKGYEAQLRDFPNG